MEQNPVPPHHRSIGFSHHCCTVRSPLTPLSGLGTWLDPTSLTPVNSSRGVIGDVFCCGAFYQAFTRRVDSLLLILESEGKHFFLWCQHCPSNRPDLERVPPPHISHKGRDSLEKHFVRPLQRSQGRKWHSIPQKNSWLALTDINCILSH